MKLILPLAAVLALVAVSGCSHKPKVTELAAKADSGVFLAGTLAALGSFEWDSSPIVNHAATAVHETAVAFKEGRITEADGQKIVDAATHANDLLLQANAVCAQDNRTGKCTGDETQARALLDQARVVLSDIP